MKIKALIVLFLILFIKNSQAQTLKIRDDFDKQALEFVSVIAPRFDFIGYSDSKGRVDISNLKGADSIIIHYVGYNDLLLSYDSLDSLNFKIGMKAKHLALEEIVVSASRWQENASDLSMKVTGITQRKIAIQNPQTSADIVGLSGEVYIQKSQQGGGSPMIRGFAANRVLIAVDGIRMNNAIFRSGNLQNIINIDPFSVAQAEVIFGPGSTLFGSDAIGGVMNFHTIEPLYAKDTSAFKDANSMIRYSSASNENTAHLDFRLGSEKIASATSFSFSRFGDLEMGSKGPDFYLRQDYVREGFSEDKIIENENPELQVGTAYNQYNLLQKFGFKPNEKMDFIYGFQYSGTTDIPRYDRLTQRSENDTLKYAQWDYGPQTWMLHSLTANFKEKTQLYDDFRMILAFQRFEESRETRRFRSPYGTINEENVNAYSANLDFKKQADERNEFFYGLEMVYNTVGSEADIFRINPEDTNTYASNSTRYPDGSNWLSAGAYLSVKSEIMDNLSLHGGLRFNQIILNAEFDSANFLVPVRDISINTSAITGSAGLNYKAQEDLIFTLNLSTGFRAPNLDDVAKVFDSEPGAVLVPNPDLKSEYAYSADIGMRKYINDAFFLKANAFYTLLDNAMVRRDFRFEAQDSLVFQGELSRVQAIQNAASAYVYGFQIGMDINFTSWLTLELKYNWQEGEEELDDGSTSRLRHVAPQFGAAQISLKKAKFEALASLIYNGEIVFRDLAVSERGKDNLYAKDELGRPFSPSWYTLNLKMGYHINDNTTFRIGIENITDQRYRPYSSGIAAAGRNFIASLSASF